MRNLIESIFPGLAAVGYRVTSPATAEYNCIAWAAEDDTTWWWPDSFGDYYWPPQAPRVETVEAFMAAYGTIGYQPCQDASLEPGFEKVAIYVDEQGVPTHAARQQPSGRWTSKLGQLEDIEHDRVDGLSGLTYGSVEQVLKRPVAAARTDTADSA